MLPAIPQPHNRHRQAQASSERTGRPDARAKAGKTPLGPRVRRQASGTGHRWEADELSSRPRRGHEAHATPRNPRRGQETTTDDPNDQSTAPDSDRRRHNLPVARQGSAPADEMDHQAGPNKPGESQQRRPRRTAPTGQARPNLGTQPTPIPHQGARLAETRHGEGRVKGRRTANIDRARPHAGSRNERTPTRHDDQRRTHKAPPEKKRSKKTRHKRRSQQAIHQAGSCAPRSDTACTADLECSGGGVRGTSAPS
jgi:hypothetical protein